MSKQSDEEISRLVMEIRLLEATLDSLRSRLEVTEATLNDSKMALETLKTIESVQKGESLLVPIGAGSYMFAKIENTDRVIMNVGANVCVEKSIKSSIETVSEQINKLEQVRAALQQQFIQSSQKLKSSREALERLIRAKEADSSAGRS